jgi:dCTP deaminase
MILTDHDINDLSTILIEPFSQENIQPSSYDLSLDGEFLIPIPDRRIDLRVDDPKDHMDRLRCDEYTLKPGASILGSTIEVVKCPHYLSSRIEGKSSIGRLFVAVHITAGVIDAGWYGQITLEIVNHGPWEIILWKGMKIAQISYFKLTGQCETPYGASKLRSHYLGQSGPTAAARRRHEQE